MVSLESRGADLEGTEAPESTAHSYPEWDEGRQVYRPGWCLVHDSVATAEPGSPVGRPDGAALRQALSRLGTELGPCRRQRQGGDLDIDAIVEARVDRVAGGPVVEDVYIDSLRRTRALSVLVLLDVSGSAAEPGVAGRTVHEHQRDAAAALVTALHRLGDRVALHAFSSRGRTAVDMAQVKGFDDGVDDVVLRRLSGLRPGAFTRLGAAVRHGSTLLEAGAGTPRRLLVVLSDGFAYDHGYEGGYAESDARRALLEARRRGIGCLCLSVGADADLAALQRVFGAAAHAALPTTDSLPASIGPLFAAALRSADAQRRRFQRAERTRGRLGMEVSAR
jgi:nitric oxide reductase activation protein